MLQKLHALLHRYDCLGHGRFACDAPALLEQWNVLYPDISTDERNAVYADTEAEARADLESGAEVIVTKNVPEMMALTEEYRK